MRIPEPTGKFGEPKLNTGKTKKISDKKPAKGVSRTSVNQSNFLKELDSATEEQIKKSLDELIEELNIQAKVLLKHRTFSELEKYKKLVKNFIDQAIKKIYSVKVSESSKLMIKRKKVYIIVERVDAELEKLTKQILKEQIESLEILATLDKIRGLLVDMYS